jgi:HNH endonuclease
MAKRIWTLEMLVRLKKEYPHIFDPRDLAASLRVSYNALKSKAGVLKLRRKAPHPRYTTATKKEDRFLTKNYLKIPEKRLAAMLGRSDVFVRTRLKRLKLKKPRSLVEKFIRDARIKPGNIPPNKGKRQTEYMSRAAINRTKATRFKKGGVPPNTLYDNAITIRRDHPERNGKPHKYIRISLSVWKELQIYNWEKKHGPIPKGHILACKNGDTLDCHPSNWKLMTKADNARRNSGSLHLKDGYVARTIIGKNGSRGLLNEILKNKDLVEAKRAELQLRRAIKMKENERSSKHK